MTTEDIISHYAKKRADVAGEWIAKRPNDDTWKTWLIDMQHALDEVDREKNKALDARLKELMK